MVKWIETKIYNVHLVKDRDGSDFITYCDENIAKENVDHIGSKSKDLEDVAADLRSKVDNENNELVSFCEKCAYNSKK